MTAVLSSAYLPPVEYFAVMAEGIILSEEGVIPSVVYLEACENYQKQSYRNRCSICTAGGREALSYPVLHDGNGKIGIRDVRIDYSVPWIIRHERAIVSAYRSSAYFEYYMDDFFSILDSKPETLFELNMSLLRFLIEKTGLSVDLRLTENWHSSSEYELSGISDLRNTIHPKRNNHILEDLGLEKNYYQVFGGKYGFMPNMSVIDLLFNEGPDSIMFLKKIPKTGRL